MRQQNMPETTAFGKRIPLAAGKNGRMWSDTGGNYQPGMQRISEIQ